MPTEPALVDAHTAPAALDVATRYIRPLALRDVRGLAWVGPDLIALDTRTGRVVRIDPATDDTRVLNDGTTAGFVGARGLAVGQQALWATTPAGLCRADWSGERVGAAVLVLPLAEAGAVAVWDDQLHLVVGRRLHVLDRRALEQRALPAGEPASAADPRPAPGPTDVDLAALSLRSVELHGVGAKGIAATADALWLSDDVEQTVYCLDRGSLATRFTVVTPLEGPTAIAARRTPGADHDELHVAYYEDEPYLKDNPWIDPCWEVRYRDRVLVHQLRVHHDPIARRAWSTGHRIQMQYFVEVEPDDDVADLTGVEWRMSLPIESARQRVVSVEPIGLPFDREEQPDHEGRVQPVAVFRIPRMDRGSRLLLGWRATLELFGVKHLVRPEDLEAAPALSAQMAAQYLIDDEDLDLDSPEVGDATAAALGEESNVLLAARRIRTHVYDRLEYEMGNADSPIGVLARGTGSCGEYVGTIMALMRRAGLACRVAGRYKCPYQPWSGAPLYPDFNHVWVDLYLPGYGWVPVESNPDDVVDGGPYPDRFFLGLPWRHVEVGKDISFEKVTFESETAGRRRRIGARRLSRNHIRFDVLGEIAPGPVEAPLAATRPSRPGPARPRG